MLIKCGGHDFEFYGSVKVGDQYQVSVVNFISDEFIVIGGGHRKLFYRL